jgi:hypothetical protein
MPRYFPKNFVKKIKPSSRKKPPPSAVPSLPPEAAGRPLMRGSSVVGDMNATTVMGLSETMGGQNQDIKRHQSNGTVAACCSPNEVSGQFVMEGQEAVSTFKFAQELLTDFECVRKQTIIPGRNIAKVAMDAIKGVGVAFSTMAGFCINWFSKFDHADKSRLNQMKTLVEITLLLHALPTSPLLSPAPTPRHFNTTPDLEFRHEWLYVLT